MKTLRPFIWNAELEDGVQTTLGLETTPGVQPGAVLIKYNNEFYVSISNLQISSPEPDENPVDYAKRKWPWNGDRSPVIKIDINSVTTEACVKCNVGTLYKVSTGEVYVYVYRGWQDEKEDTPENNASHWMKIQGYRKP